MSACVCSFSVQRFIPCQLTLIRVTTNHQVLWEKFVLLNPIIVFVVGFLSNLFDMPIMGSFNLIPHQVATFILI